MVAHFHLIWMIRCCSVDKIYPLIQTGANQQKTKLRTTATTTNLVVFLCVFQSQSVELFLLFDQSAMESRNRTTTHSGQGTNEPANDMSAGQKETLPSKCGETHDAFIIKSIIHAYWCFWTYKTMNTCVYIHTQRHTHMYNYKRSNKYVAHCDYLISGMGIFQFTPEFQLFWWSPGSFDSSKFREKMCICTLF